MFFDSLSDYVNEYYGPLAQYEFVIIDFNYAAWNFYNSSIATENAGIFYPKYNYNILRISSVFRQTCFFFPSSISTCLLMPDKYYPSNPSQLLPITTYKVMTDDEINIAPYIQLNPYLYTIPNVKVLIPYEYTGDNTDVINVWQLSSEDLTMLNLLIETRQNPVSSAIPEYSSDDLSTWSALFYTEILILINEHENASNFLYNTVNNVIASDLTLANVYWLKLSSTLATDYINDTN